MNKINEFLESLSNRELAYFIKFKRNKYSKETLILIDEFIVNRNLTQTKIDKLISPNFCASKNQTQLCPRCGSDNFLINSVQLTNNIRNSGGQNNMKSADNFFEIKVEKRDEVTCNVCDYLVKDPNNRRPRTKLSKYSIWNIFDWLLN